MTTLQNTMKEVVYVKRETCCVCGSSELVFEHSIRDFDSDLGVFELVKCARCGMYYTSPHPTPDTLANLYFNRDTRNFDAGNSGFFTKIKSFLAKRLIRKLIQGVPANKKISIVDFGCGNGEFSLSFQEVMPQADVYAVDFASQPPAGLRAHQRAGKYPHYMCTPDFYKDDRKYDIIFMRHVLEHADNPLEMLRALLRKLTDTGFIYIEVPNIKNGLRLFFNNYLPSYYPPYHLMHYTRENMAYLLKKLDVPYALTQTEMPLMSNIVANRLHARLNNWHRLWGVLLHPVQLALCCKEHTVLVAKVGNKSVSSLGR